MFKLFIFTIFVVSSPSFVLLESLSHDCYSRCQSNDAKNLNNLNACKKGCDYKSQNEDCTGQCKLNFIDEQNHDSCLVGCSINQPEIEKVRQRTIFLIQLRPVLRLPSINSDPVQTINDIIKQLKERTDLIEQSNDLSKSNQLKTVLQLAKNIPIIKSTDEIYFDSTLNGISKNDENNQSLINNFQRSINSIGKQMRLPGWILFGIFLLSSAILWRMIVSICKIPIQYDLLNRTRELVFGNVDEKEKFQPNEQNCKTNLSNV